MKIIDNNTGIDRQSESGIAIVLALITLLIISIMAVSVSFVSNTDFQTMSNYKAGEESFLAAERCTVEARKSFEIDGIETIVALQTIDQIDGFRLTLPNASSDGSGNHSKCRSGPRFFDDAGSELLPFVNLPEGVKTIERSIKDTMLPSGGESGPTAAAISFEVVGKHPEDRDADDEKDEINTGTQISVGIETFMPGGGSNVY